MTTLRYLIVDDDPVFCNTLARSIAHLGNETLTAYDEADALNFAQNTTRSAPLSISNSAKPRAYT